MGQNGGSRNAALVVAGGVGSRLGADMPKQMLPLLGRPILAHTLDRFLAFDPDMTLTVVLHASLLPGWEAFVEDHFLLADRRRLSACAGGPDRSASVHNGLQHLLALGLPEDSLVAIHDGVRPLISDALLQRGFALASDKGNAVAAVPVKSSLRRRTPEGSEAVDRSAYFHVQTPQIFRLGAISQAYQNRPEGSFTDDASLAEALGMNIHLFEGSYDNLKITTPEDMQVAAQLMGGEQ